MPFCSLEEAWGGSSAKYPNSDIVNREGKSIYVEDDCPKEKKPRQKSFSRTNERLQGHSGPVNRYDKPVYKNQIIKFSKENKRYMDEPELSDSSAFNYENSQSNITEYDDDFRDKEDKVDPPTHTIERRNKKREIPPPPTPVVAKKYDSEDDDDMSTIEKIIQKDETSDDENHEPVNIHGKFRELSKKYSNKNQMIKFLLHQNEKLEKMVKNKLAEKPNGFFSIWDLVVIIFIGIVMIVVLDYVYKIAVKKTV
jgi:hypothetical protein